MRMRRLGAVLATLSLLTVGCTSVIDGRAVAGDEPGTGVGLSRDGFGVELGTSRDARIEFFLEPQCPHCGEFFGEYVQQMNEHINDGNLTLTLRPVTFLDDDVIDYSARASNAIFLVADEDGASPALVMAFVAQLFENMLQTNVEPTDDDIAQVADDVGASADTVNRVAAGEPALDPVEMNDANLATMDSFGSTSTPTVFDLESEAEVDLDDPLWLDKVVGK
jgi:protein-disulfide isomerase